MKKILFTLIVIMVSGCTGMKTLKSYNDIESLSKNLYHVKITPESNEAKQGKRDQILFTVTINKNRPNYYYAPSDFLVESDFPAYGDLFVKKGQHKVAGYFTIKGQNLPVIPLPINSGHKLLIPIQPDGSLYHKAYNNGGSSFDLKYASVLGNWKASKDVKFQQLDNNYFPHDEFSVIYRGRDGDFIYFDEQNFRTGETKTKHTNARPGTYNLDYVTIKIHQIDGEKILYSVL